MWQRIKNVYHLVQAVAANSYFRFPGKKLLVIGITGTDGKTTTVNLIYHILNAAGKNVSMISTIGALINGKASPLGFHVTNPTSWPLQKFLHNASKHNGKENYLVLEVTSHGLDQNRVWGIPFAIAGLTNITHEHLDYHKTYAEYLRAKSTLLKRAKVSILNKDDTSYALLMTKLQNTPAKIRTYGKKDATYTFKNTSGTEVFKEEYNRYNALLAFAICESLRIDKKTIANALQTFTFPKGRTDMVNDGAFKVMIDFAHTPNAFEKLLPETRKQTSGKIIHVFGSAGLRDKSKRPKMGKASSQYADIIILTSEDPRTEKVADINAMIKQGIDSRLRGNDKGVMVLEIPDRNKAIRHAISLAKKGDFVLLTGKAHEKSMNYGNGEQPWDEYDAVKQALQHD